MEDARLRLLMVEDSEDDALLVLRELRRAGYDVAHERVLTSEDFVAALRRGGWDAVISDYSLPGLEAPDVLALFRQQRIDIPFIIVSGTIDEESAIASLRAGAHDFVTKAKLARLAPALERELREAAARRDRARLQEHLLLTDRMASLGLLAAGIVHEINNPLAAVISNIEFIGEQVEPGGDLHACVVDAREAAERVRLTLNDVRVFSRGAATEEPTLFDVHEVLDSSVRMARHETRSRARVVREFASVPPISGEPPKLGQVFLNLILNAAQAIDEGAPDRNEIRIVTRSPADDQVVVEVHDTGSGIPEEIAAHIFEPFVTTKPLGVGTGLGLSICRRIVTQLGGTLTAAARPEGGSVFRVCLPAARSS